MKVKLEANAVFDLLTKQELDESLRGWMAEIARGARFRSLSAQAPVNGGVFTLADINSPNVPGQTKLAPEDGFVWSVTRLTVGDIGFKQGTDAYTVYRNQVSPSQQIGMARITDSLWDVGQFILNPKEQVVVSGAATLGGAQVTVSIGVVELPVQLAWQLL